MSIGVDVVGAAMSPFTRNAGVDPVAISQDVVLTAARQAGFGRDDLDVAYVSNTYETAGFGQRTLKDLGLVGMPITNIENACASGSDALVHAVRAVQLGARAALALGCDTPTRFASSGILPLLSADPALDFGLTAPALYALRARRYLSTYDVGLEDLAAVSVVNRQHGALNPCATLRTPVTLEEVLESPVIAEPLTRLQCCPVSDGAAAVIVARRASSGALCTVRGAQLRSGTLQDKPDAVDDVTTRTAAAAFDEADVEVGDLDFCEVHDAFSIGELLAVEDLGVCGHGEAGEYLARGLAAIGGGGVVINPSGGLLARGHPPAATGLAQVVEAALQLSGTAGDRQIEGARLGACHTRGGASYDLDANACAVIVLERASSSQNGSRT